MLTINAPPRADQKLSTWNPSINRPTNRNNKALITITPSPKVSRMNGKVNKTSSGLRTALSKLSTRTTTTNVLPSSQWMPGTNFVASITPIARMPQRSRS